MAEPVDIDADTESAALALWQTDTATLPKLFKSLPHVGRLKQDLPNTAGPAPAPLPRPYARIGSEYESREKASTAGAWWDRRKLTVEVWGKRSEVVAALAAIKTLFCDLLGIPPRPNFVYPSTDPGTGLPRFYRYEPVDGGKDEIDKDTAQGEDVWHGTVTGRVTSIRTE